MSKAQLMEKILVRQLGNGGAFDYDQTNTAFTLFDDQILVDCGYNIFPKLMSTTDENGVRLADKIKYIFITHIHDDHIGSLMTYLYWIELIRKTPIKVFGNFNTLLLLNEYYINEGIYEYPNKERRWNFIKTGFLGGNRGSAILSLEEPIQITYLSYETHGSFENTVYMFDYKTQSTKPTRIVITGDTKAYKEIEEVAYNEFKETLNGKSGKLIVFHDYFKYSTLNVPHATEIDINAVYSEKFKNYLVYVHTGNQNFKEIYTMNDLKEVK